MIERTDVKLSLKRNWNVVQSAWVVADLDQAICNWLMKGVGPFLTFEVNIPDTIYHGRDIVPLRARYALGQAGPTQIELIQQLSPGPSAYRDMVAEGQTGFHHIWNAVNDVDEEIAAVQREGGIIATEARLNGVRFCYADMRSTLGCMVELAALTESTTALLDLVANAARDWDGRDPIRPISGLLRPYICRRMVTLHGTNSARN